MRDKIKICLLALILLSQVFYIKIVIDGHRSRNARIDANREQIRQNNKRIVELRGQPFSSPEQIQWELEHPEAVTNIYNGVHIITAKDTGCVFSNNTFSVQYNTNWILKADPGTWRDERAKP